MDTNSDEVKCKNSEEESKLVKSELCGPGTGTPSIWACLIVTIITAVLSNLAVDWTKSKYLLEATKSDIQPPKYAIFLHDSDDKHLRHVIEGLNQFGYERVGVNDSWDLLWAHDYPFSTLPKLKNLESHRLVNHFPGCGFLTNKVDLCTSELPFLPRAFRLPEQKEAFLDYAEKHPETLYVQKHNQHRHIKIRSPKEIGLWANDSFVQEFIQRPFLVDGHKFDIGVYVVITSINPVRVYIYTGDVLFRYCPTKYYPFDPEDVDKYIVGDDYLPTWEVPSLRKYYNRFGGSMRSAFEAYVRDQSLDPSKIWPQVEHIIRTTILAKEKDITGILRNYKTHNFFDLMRFDLFIDEDLNVRLMEANMSPNLSSAHFKPNSLLYKQLLNSVFNLVGIRPWSAPGETMFSQATEIITADKNLATDLNQCVSNDCDKSCNKEECSLCLLCLRGSEYQLLQKSHQEHLHRVDMKRIIPQPILDFTTFDINEETKNLSSKNAWLTRWFYNKCEYDPTWCT
ncbi:uncharacterized protein Dwil_GK13901 [Drosophila willistoni]|uniref:Uncharacterized protein n=1 Tax=Drosophila willistoni TaxID=7260 RepID=B4NJY7_DROWI|nr:probable tubulin polyglutamylase ttll-15 [Drosophila willistoni]EDW83989.1 uncharacterized protein Dwil_GK13901 [Drosophila willistoni]